jgi:hypothetical protein
LGDERAFPADHGKISMKRIQRCIDGTISRLRKERRFRIIRLGHPVVIHKKSEDNFDAA